MLVKRYQQAYAEATYQLLNNKEKATAVLSKWLQQKNPESYRRDLPIHRDEFFFSDADRAAGFAQYLGDGLAERTRRSI